MRVYHLDRLEQADYGLLDGCVVIALNETAARHLVADGRIGNAERQVWLSPEMSEIRDLGEALSSEEEFILGDVREG